jgi:phage baseplate assembly protein W
MATLLDITNNTWQLSADAFGEVVQGVNSIRQRIDIVLRTSLGSDPLRPEFGTEIYQYVDASVLVAAPAIKAEIITALAIWMPEVFVNKITHTTNGGHISFNITYGLVDSDIVDTITYSPTYVSTNSFVPKKLSLAGSVPENPSNYQYFVALTLNGTVQPPFAPANGFASVNELFAFIQASYSYLAFWTLQGEFINGNLKDQQYTSGSIAVTLKQIYKALGLIPQQLAGETLTLAFSEVLSGAIAPQPAAPFTTKSELLTWVQTNLSAYGTWAIETTPGDFNSDFNNDFSSVNSYLALYSPIYNQAAISITIS